MTSREEELVAAVKSNDLASLKSTLAKEDIKDSDLGRNNWEWQRAPLHQAASLARDEMVLCLVEKGFNVNSTASYKKVNGTIFEPVTTYTFTSLHQAARQGHTSTVEILLDLGADPDLQGTDVGLRGTPADWARAAEHSGRMDKVFQEHAADKNGKSSVQTIIEKVESQSAKEQQLARAVAIQEEIDTKEAALRKLVEKKTAVEEGIATLKSDQGYMSGVSMRKLRKELDQIDKLVDAFQKKTKKEEKKSSEVKLCPVCMMSPQAVFSCSECENWMCGECRHQAVTCPKCRQDFKVNPPRRNLAIERILARI